MKRQRIIKILRKLSATVAVLPLVFSFIMSYFQPTPTDSGERLSFVNEFVILAVSGLFSTGETAYLEEKIDEIQPDLVVLCGDNVLPQTLASDLLLAGTMQIIDRYAELFENKKTYFCVAFSNYDISGLYDKSAQLKRFMRSDYFVGGVRSFGNIQVMKDSKKANGNFRISIFRGKDIAFFIYIADTSEQALTDEQKNWLAAAHKPFVLFSYKQAYGQEGWVFFSSAEEQPFGIKRSGIYQKGEVSYDYSAKKIVLTANGELFQSDIK